MLTQLRLFNFQIHHKLTVDLDPFVTCITGRTDAGKSSVIRALRWVLLNQPNGSEHIRHGESKCSVTLTMDDGHKLVRKRSENENTYLLDGEEYKAFGQGVPDDIAKLANVDDVNFQRQLDSPFWFLETPGQVSRELNQIVNLGVIDDALSAIATEVRKSRSTVELTEERLTAARREKEQLAYVHEMNESLLVLEAIESDLAENVQKRIFLTGTLESVESVALLRDRSSAARSEGVELCSRWQSLLSEQARAFDLRNLLSECERYYTIRSSETPDLSELEQMQQEHDNQRGQVARLRRLIEQAEEQESLRCETSEQVQAAAALLKKKFGEKCPVCGKSSLSA